MTENNLKIESAAISDKGLSKKRPQNEDSFLEMNARGLFAVADGVGGAQAGDVASQMAVEILSEAFDNMPAGGDAEDMMKVAVERANRSIYQMSHDLTELSTMATTFVGLHIAGNIATIGHVGDSRLYRLDPKGNLYRETQDHSVVEEEVRAGRMTEAQAANHPSRNIISRALGADFTVEVDMKTIMFEPNTMFLLCSDGITRHISDEEIGQLLVSGAPLANITQKMKAICYERGAEDNLTAVIAKIFDENAEARNIAAVLEENNSVHDFEEPTVATARVGDGSAATTTLADSEPRKTTPLEILPIENVTRDENETKAQREIIENATVVRSQTIPLVAEEKLAAPPPVNQTIETRKPGEAAAVVTENKTEKTTEKIIETKVETNRVGETAEQGSGGKMGRILSALLWLILGGMAGAGLYYLFERNNKPVEPPVVAQQQSEDVNLTTFEKKRRDVDRNPQQYLAANSTIAPADAESFYLLGRANLYSGRFAEAKQMFAQAKDRLAQTGETNNRVLSNDIETGLIIVGVPLAQDEFKRVMNLNQTDANTPQTNQNTNTNQTNQNVNTNQTTNNR